MKFEPTSKDSGLSLPGDNYFSLVPNASNIDQDIIRNHKGIKMGDVLRFSNTYLGIEVQILSMPKNLPAFCLKPF